METYRYNTLRFFRVQFGLPARMPLECASYGRPRVRAANCGSASR